MATPNNEELRELFERQLGRMYARVIDYRTGLTVTEGIKAIRVHSRDYNLLIMEDYMPILGRVDGSVSIMTRNGETVYDNMHGFYKHQHNEFTLLIERAD